MATSEKLNFVKTPSIEFQPLSSYLYVNFTLCWLCPHREKLEKSKLEYFLNIPLKEAVL